MSDDFIKIGKYCVPRKLFDNYVKWTMTAEGYLNKTIKTPQEQMGINSPAVEYERSMRWQMCVKKVMEIHREICKELEIEYTTDLDDDFYSAFHREVNQQTRLKG